MPRALLIDDEALARTELRRLLAAHPDVAIVGEADDVSSARARLAPADYDLVFLDIQLAGGSGFDLIPHVAPAAAIVFVTAHDAFALRAFEVNALDYLLKPVPPTRLAESLARLAVRPAGPVPLSADPTDPADRPLGLLAAGDSIFLRNDRTARFVPLRRISVVASCDNYSEVHLDDRSRFLVRRSLKTWENSLPQSLFVRVHRQSLVNLEAIERIDGLDRQSPTLRLRGVAQPVACSHRLSPELLRRLSGDAR